MARAGDEYKIMEQLLAGKVEVAGVRLVFVNPLVQE